MGVSFFGGRRQACPGPAVIGQQQQLNCIRTSQQELLDLRTNNEALVGMVERERHHAQQLAERLQQAEANALEVLPRQRQKRTPSTACLHLVVACLP